jgi:glycosyltransferase involved in cell wall biosynthesis
MKYFVVTSTKNEEKNIPYLIKFVEEQSIKPVLWTIVDNSTDSTKEIIRKFAEKKEWVKLIDQEKNNGYLGINYGIACNIGFNYSIEYCRQQGIKYDYIGLIDADVTVEKDFFERLMIQFEKYPRLGIVSGAEYWNISGELVSANTREDLPMGPARLWRKKCFEETDGYMAVSSPDSVSIVKAKLRGWKTKQLKDIKVITRRSSTARGYWWGAVHDGKNYHYLNHNPILILSKSIKCSLKKPYYIGLGLFIGYLTCIVQRRKKIDDIEIRYYYRYTRPKEIINYYIHKLKKRG